MPVADKLVADLDVADATLVSGAVSVLPDNIGSTDAAQGTAANRPQTSTANGFPTLVFDGSNDSLLWPRSTASNQTNPAFGIAFWFRADNTTYSEIYNCAPDSANGGRIYVTFSENNAGQINVYMGVSGGNSYRIGSTASGAYSATTWTFLYIDYDGSQGTEAGKLRIYLGTTLENLASVSLTFSGDSTMPATPNQPTDDFQIGNETAIGAPYDGQIGAHIWCLDERATLAEAQELMAIDPPVALTNGMDGAATLAAVTASGTASVDVTMDGTATLAAVTAAGEASVLVAMDGEANLAAVTAAGEASVEVHADGEATLAAIVAEGEASTTPLADHTLDGAATLAAVTAAGTASVDVALDGAATLAAVTASGEASVAVAMDGAATLAAVTAAGLASTAESVAGNVASSLALVGRVTTAAAIVGGLDTTIAPVGRVTTAVRQT